MTIGIDFHCFKEGIEPKWEDPLCAQGGKWSMSSPRGKSMTDTFWLYTVSNMYLKKVQFPPIWLLGHLCILKKSTLKCVEMTGRRQSHAITLHHMLHNGAY